MTDSTLTAAVSFQTLEGMVEGKFPEAANLIVMGSPGVGKTIFTQTLLRDAYKQGLRCIYATTSSPPENIRSVMKTMGVGVGKSEGDLIIVDLYSWLLGEHSSERFYVDNASDLAAVSIVLTSATEVVGKRAFLLLDCLSTILAYNSEEMVSRFLKSHLARMRKSRHIGVYTLEMGIHSNSFYNQLRSNFDGVIEMKLEEVDGELKRYARVYSFAGPHETRWCRFQIMSDRTLKMHSGTIK